MGKKCAKIMGILFLVSWFLAPAPGIRSQAQSLLATFFVAHVESHQDASVVPITVLGGQAVAFEVGVRDAGTSPKAGWQVRLLLDACTFETPTVEDILFGDYMVPGSLIPIGPEIQQNGNTIRIDLGQVALAGSTTASGGLARHDDANGQDTGGVPQSGCPAARPVLRRLRPRDPQHAGRHQV